MSWTTLEAIAAVRRKISDNATDKKAYRKLVVGIQNGVNTRFKTFEPRRLTDFNTADVPFGVYVNNVLAGISDDDLETGEFGLNTAPVDGDRVEATYYYRWFTDDQILGFLAMAADFVVQSDDYTQIVPGLKPCAIHFAAAEAYHELAARWALHFSTQFRTEDVPDAKYLANPWLSLEKQVRATASMLRKQFYENRGDQALAPLWGSVNVGIARVEPNR